MRPLASLFCEPLAHLYATSLRQTERKLIANPERSFSLVAKRINCGRWPSYRRYLPVRVLLRRGCFGDQPSAQGVEATHLCGLVIGRVFWPIAGHTYVPDELAPPFSFP